MDPVLLIELKRTRTMLVVVLLVVGCIHAWNYDHARNLAAQFERAELEVLDECIAVLEEEAI